MRFSRRLLPVLLLLLPAAPLAAQTMPVGDVALAKEYARKGENEKAVFLFSRLPSAEQQRPDVLPDYLTALQALRNYKEAER